MLKPNYGLNRVMIEDVMPQIDSGRYPVRHITGDPVTVTAAIFGDGHDHVSARVLYRSVDEPRWRNVPMQALGNDLWNATFTVDDLGEWRFTIEAWVDHFETWTADMRKRIAAKVESDAGIQSAANVSAGDLSIAFLSGAVLLRQGAGRSTGLDAERLSDAALLLEQLATNASKVTEYPLADDIHRLMARHPDLTRANQFEPELPLWVDRERARFSSWYEMFPRSASPVPGQHGTFTDVERQLPEIAAMGFDVLYLPPIHPIGRAFRKGPNNSTTSGPDAEGSPWAIGDVESRDVRPDGTLCQTHCGGHKAIHPKLGTFKEFESLVRATKMHGMEIALDIAFQCSPDHPWVKNHPSWFVIRPDGTIQYAENPPKKYQDIYPLNFESPDWRELWDELHSVFEFWIERGVSIFRVDNPHTKAFPFWEWCIRSLGAKYPETIFLAEAFTRPHVMYGLAKRGFTQSYTYFTWRNYKVELEQYLEEITRPPVSDFFRPNFWPNTPDILHKTLQDGGKPAFEFRLILAGTMTANYGIYGPAYELCENTPAVPAPGRTESEEYMDSEKYEIRQRDRNAPGSLVPLITRLNRIRRGNPALQSNERLWFHATDNSELICYSKNTADFGNTILTIVNLDASNVQSGWTDLDLSKLNLKPGERYIVEDLLTGEKFAWAGNRNYVALQPGVRPAHIFRVIPQP